MNSRNSERTDQTEQARENTTETQNAGQVGEGDDATRADEAAHSGEEELEGFSAESTTGTESAAPSLLSEVTSAEALGLAGLALSGMALIGSRLTEILSSVTATDQLGAIANTILGDGGFALLGVVLGVIALGRANALTRPWARWLAAAAIIVGGIGVVVAAVAYPMVPSPQPQPPMQMPQ